MTEQVLVTGVGGFVGSHVAEALVASGRTVRGIDNFHSFYDPAVKRRTVDALRRSPRFAFVEGDVRRSEAVSAAMAGCDAVIHCAARPGVRDSWGAREELTDINVTGTRVVVQACRRAGTARMVFVSSSSVYGDGVVPSEESAPLYPCSPYAESKVAAEDVCREFGSRDGSVAIVRLFSVYGPRLRPDLAIHRFVACLAAGVPVTRFGDGATSRDYTHVSDAARGLLAALEWTARVRPGCDTFNVGSGRPVALDELIATLGEVMQRPARVEAQPAARGDVRHTWADLAKAARDLRYQPRVPLREGLCSVRRWYEEVHGNAP